ncbi:MAG: hypothetical protein AAF840_13815, partial [Bacteroidota bacterium]
VKLAPDFVRPERGPVTLHLPGNRLQQLLADVDHIVNYPYACTEQTASRLIGLLALKQIRTAEGKPFTKESQIRKMVRRLEKLRRRDGGFGWWSSSVAASPWISLHVYTALNAAADQGYPVKDLRPLQRYLVSKVPELSVNDQLQILLTLAENGPPPTTEEMARLDTIQEPTDYQLLALTRLHQLRGDTVDTQRLLDSSSRHAVLGRYWGEQRFGFGRQPLHSRVANGLLAVRIFQEAGDTLTVNETINYLLGRVASGPQAGNVPLLGTNTLESAKLVAGLLPVLLQDGDVLTPPFISLAANNTVRIIKDFPFSVEIAPEDLSSVNLMRWGNTPLPVSISQRWFEAKPTEQDQGFRIETRLTDARQRSLGQLTRGTKAFLEVTVANEADADYVLIEVPIPAGCSFDDRMESRGPYAVHREYRRDRVAIFCDRLPAGQHVYRVALAPRFSGAYTLNPARAEMQYVPGVNGNGGIEGVRIEGLKE